MFPYHFIAGPVVGGVIGYITNALAIRMLFRPYTAKYIFRWKLPFTPGIIPKEKDRIALAIGTAISDNLMSREVLEKNLLSPDMQNRIETSLRAFINRQKENHESFGEALTHIIPKERLEAILEDVRTESSDAIASRLKDACLGELISDSVVDHFSGKLRLEGIDLPLASHIKKIFSTSFWEKIASALEKPLRTYLAKNINSIIEKNGNRIISGLIKSQGEKLLSSPVSSLLENKDQQIDKFVESVMEIYRSIISEGLPKMLETINISSIIEGRIRDMDMKETEQLIFQVMNKELKAIIWLGALLGTIMGMINTFL